MTPSMGPGADASTERWACPGARRGAVAVVGAAAVVLAAPLSLRATVEEQRARLPPPARCDDPVEGEWRAQQYNPRHGYWTRFVLTVRRVAPGSAGLTGAIEARAWTGGPAQTEPPRCAPGVLDWTVDLPATGRYAAATRAITFEGTSWRVRAVHCEPWARYNVDRFAGTIDPAREEFQSVHNDGGRVVNVAKLFRRVRCGARGSAADAAPPAPPPSRRGGCGR